MGFIQKIQQFMYGRNGFDTYSFFLFIVALAVSTANFFVWGYWASLVLYVVQLLILAYAVFRILSKSVHKRSAENRRFVVFVEVKTRQDAAFGEAKEFVDQRKQERVRMAAALWLSEHETEKQPRFDVVEVYAPLGTATERPVIRHWENAF